MPLVIKGDRFANVFVFTMLMIIDDHYFLLLLLEPACQVSTFDGTPPNRNCNKCTRYKRASQWHSSIFRVLNRPRIFLSHQLRHHYRYPAEQQRTHLHRHYVIWRKASTCHLKTAMCLTVSLGLLPTITAEKSSGRNKPPLGISCSH